IKGDKLVVVPTLTLKEQWEERIKKFIPEFQNETEVVTYHAYEKLRNREFSLIIFDECQHLPANTFIRLSTLKTKYRLGFSGSPFR
ncbi:MAG: helicase, partial [Candidatus Komeilibacteria bacterium CG_4_9_14_0_8_um_filter_36_9]